MNWSASSPHPSPPFGMEERVPEGRERRRFGFKVRAQVQKEQVAFHELERLLSPSLSSIPNGGEGARRAGEEALRVQGPCAGPEGTGGYPRNRWTKKKSKAGFTQPCS